MNFYCGKIVYKIIQKYYYICSSIKKHKIEENKLSSKLKKLRNPFPAVFAMVIIIAFSCTKISYSSFYANIPAEKAITFKPVIERMLAKGMDSAFVFELVANPLTEFNKRYIKINVTGYLSPPDYTKFYNEESIGKTKKFIEENLEILERAEKKYKVEKEVIASILWIETRHGSYLGNNHIPSVFLSAALSNEKDFIDLNIAELDAKFDGTPEEHEKLVEKVKSRSKRKADWALGELVSLEKINSKMPYPVDSLYGSWAGAFGMSQFLPSSYKSLAVDGNGDGKIDLFNVDDAVYSVANYLSANGWKQTEKSQRKAVYRYNNSTAYVDAVLKLCEMSK